MAVELLFLVGALLRPPAGSRGPGRCAPGALLRGAVALRAAGGRHGSRRAALRGGALGAGWRDAELRFVAVLDWDGAQAVGFRAAAPEPAVLTADALEVVVERGGPALSAAGWWVVGPAGAQPVLEVEAVCPVAVAEPPTGGYPSQRRRPRMGSGRGEERHGPPTQEAPSSHPGPAGPARGEAHERAPPG